MVHLPGSYGLSPVRGLSYNDAAGMVNDLRPPLMSGTPKLTNLPAGDGDTGLLVLLTTMHLKSRPLLGLPPCMYMSRSQVVQWESEKAIVRLILKEATDSFLAESTDTTSLALVNAVLALLDLFASTLPRVRGIKQFAHDVTVHMPDGSLLPFHVDGRTQSKRADSPSFFDDGPLNDGYAVAARDFDTEADKEVRAAQKAIAIGRESKVSRIMTSNGVAPREAATASLLKEMHPKIEKELILPEPEGPQLVTTAEACFARIKANAGSITAPVDLYGFSDEALCHDRGQPKLETLSWEIARLQEILGSGMAPRALYFMMVTGALTPINKDEAAETLDRIEQGAKRRLRPVNSGCGLLKTPLREALSQPAAKRALAELLPIQMGQGMQSGPQTKVFLARLLYEAGYFSSLQDAINAFNAIHRQVIMDAAKEMWPEATLLINGIYGPKAPCLYVYTASDGTLHVECMLSEQGARMGCVLGGTIFNMAVHLRIYKIMAVEFPGFVQRALTDDFSQFGKPAEDTAPGWLTTFDYLAKALERYDALANPIGIFRHDDKGRILLPPNAPDPPAGHRLLELTKVTRDVVRIAGGFSGTDEATKAQAMIKAETGARKVFAAARLAKVEPQAATKILAYASHHTLDYFWGVTPTHLVADAVSSF